MNLSMKVSLRAAIVLSVGAIAHVEPVAAPNRPMLANCSVCEPDFYCPVPDMEALCELECPGNPEPCACYTSQPGHDDCRPYEERVVACCPAS